MRMRKRFVSPLLFRSRCVVLIRARVCVHLYHYCVHVCRLPLPIWIYIINYTIKVTARPTAAVAVATLTHCPNQPFVYRVWL